MPENARLLIVDDELLIRDLLYDHFSSCDYSIALAENGQTALERAKEQQFDAVIMDLKMPDMDGLDVAAQLQETQGNVPVIIITGYPSVENAVGALRQRCYDYFVKPFNLKKLAKRVQAAVTEGRHVSDDRQHA